MSASPDRVASSESHQIPPFETSYISWAQELIKYGTLATVGIFSSVKTTEVIYDLNYRIFGLLTSDLSLLDQYRSTNLGMAALGGFLAADYFYRKIRTTS